MFSFANIVTDSLPAYSDSEIPPEDLNDSCSDLELDVGYPSRSSSPMPQLPYLTFKGGVGTWLSDDLNSDLDSEDDINEFADSLFLPVKFDFHPCIGEEEQDMSEEVHCEDPTIPGISMVPSQCDWSADIHPSHEKANYSPGVALMPDSPELVKVRPLKLPNLI